ncbi:MAG: hypothetical protein ACQGVK_22920 [Myxococcota bacterium]
MRERTVLWRTPALATSLLAAALGCQTTLTSTVKGSKTPPTVHCADGQTLEVSNGGFTIAQECLFQENGVAGDGFAEVTFWEFDVSRSEDFADCYPESALIELHLRPQGDVLQESLRVEGKWDLGLEEIQSLEVGVDQQTTIDMMVRGGRPSPYTPGEIQALLMAEPQGRLPMVYEQNAVIHFARLEIRCVK